MKNEKMSGLLCHLKVGEGSSLLERIECFILISLAKLHKSCTTSVLAALGTRMEDVFVPWADSASPHILSGSPRDPS